MRWPAAGSIRGHDGFRRAGAKQRICKQPVAALGSLPRPSMDEADLAAVVLGVVGYLLDPLVQAVERRLTEGDMYGVQRARGGGGAWLTRLVRSKQITAARAPRQ